MTRDIDVSDPLSWAIGEFREELLLWIDTELVRLQQQIDDSVIDEEQSESEFNGSSSRVSATRESPFPRTGVARGARPRERVVERYDPAVETLKPPVPHREPRTDPESRLPVSNPRQRLDALARLLDQRLKQGKGLQKRIAARVLEGILARTTIIRRHPGWRVEHEHRMRHSDRIRAGCPGSARNVSGKPRSPCSPQRKSNGWGMNSWGMNSQRRPRPRSGQSSGFACSAEMRGRWRSPWNP